MVEWIIFPSGKKLCKCHYKQLCPSYPSANTHTPSFPLENRKDKNVKSKKFTNNSRIITNNSRRVIVERFHSYRVKFNALVEWDNLFQFPEYFLNNNVRFKRLDFSKAIVKVFRKSILITLRSSCDIKGLPVKEAKLRADSIIDEILAQLPKAIKIIDTPKVSSVHNAFMNHPTAKHNITVEVNGEKRLISDNSHGVSEFEAVHPVYAVSDSEALESDNEALINRGLSRDFIAQSLEALIKDREYYAENLREHVTAIKGMAFMFKRLSKKIRR